MKNLILIILLIVLGSGCALKRVKVYELGQEKVRKVGKENKEKKEESSSAYRRSDKFFECVRELNREGFRQSLIKELCEAGLGAL